MLLHIELERVQRPLGTLNRSRQLRNSKIKREFIFTSSCFRRHRRHSVLSSLLIELQKLEAFRADNTTFARNKNKTNAV